MDDLPEAIERRLRGNLRLTPERRVILAHACRHLHHFRPADLLESLRRHGGRVSRATVYRTIRYLVRAGLLRRHEMGRRQTFYEPVVDRPHHEHMVCVRCGKILEFVQDEIERLQEQACREKRFLPLSHTLQIQGVCADCRAERPKDEAHRHV